MEHAQSCLVGIASYTTNRKVVGLFTKLIVLLPDLAFNMCPLLESEFFLVLTETAFHYHCNFLNFLFKKQKQQQKSTNNHMILPRSYACQNNNKNKKKSRDEASLSLLSYYCLQYKGKKKSKTNPRLLMSVPLLG